MIARLHYITEDISSHTPPELARLACLGGVKWVQLRMKKQPAEQWGIFVAETLKVCREFGAKLIINDHVALAAKHAVDGVHLGKTDMPVEEARKILGPDFIIGATANSLSDLELIAHTSANYIGLGPFRFTTTKENLSPVLGADGIASLVSQFKKISSLPVIAIGGIKKEDIMPLMKTGVYGIALSSAINHDKHPDEAARIVIQEMENASELYTLIK
ncbi:MAG TPA: thiamine phosphate synthase [Bacteroidia bacterium]|jgi:thiamine-phosphate pyrophosphorylase|nr:thiamine phosphate synthase [Bacteroidia bacterium]